MGGQGSVGSVLLRRRREERSGAGGRCEAIAMEEGAGLSGKGSYEADLLTLA